jgi:hypothetical protein
MVWAGRNPSPVPQTRSCVKVPLTSIGERRVGDGCGGVRPPAGRPPACRLTPDRIGSQRLRRPGRPVFGRRLRRAAPLTVEGRPGNNARRRTRELDGRNSRCGRARATRPRRPGRAGRPPAESLPSPNLTALPVVDAARLRGCTPADGLLACPGQATAAAGHAPWRRRERPVSGRLEDVQKFAHHSAAAGAGSRSCRVPADALHQSPPDT